MGLGPRGLALCAGLGIFFGVGGYTFHYAERLWYLSNDPRARVNCHIMRDQHDGWAHSSHHAVATCNDCHTTSADSTSPRPRTASAT
jgi:cytochrome c nitrite reductase small subunit